jgi:hypothetical protein
VSATLPDLSKEEADKVVKDIENAYSKVAGSNPAPINHRLTDETVPPRRRSPSTQPPSTAQILGNFMLRVLVASAVRGTPAAQPSERRGENVIAAETTGSNPAGTTITGDPGEPRSGRGEGCFRTVQSGPAI